MFNQLPYLPALSLDRWRLHRIVGSGSMSYFHSMDRFEADALFRCFSAYQGFQELQKDQDLLNLASFLYAIQRLGKDNACSEDSFESNKKFEALSEEDKKTFVKTCF